MKKFVISAVGLMVACGLSSCATNAQTGALGGSAAGAIIGQAVGHSAGATLLGAAIGGGAGYMLGNEADKANQQRAAVGQPVPAEYPPPPPATVCRQVQVKEFDVYGYPHWRTINQCSPAGEVRY